MKKAEHLITRKIIEVMKNDYNLIMYEGHATGISRHLLKYLNYSIYEQLVQKNDILYELLKRYYSTTKLDERNLKNHSAYWFMRFIDRSGYKIEKKSFLRFKTRVDWIKFIIPVSILMIWAWECFKTLIK